MRSYLKTSIILYIRRFPLYITILSPVMIPTIFLHIVGRYANFGELAAVFTAIFGVILNIITLFIVLSLIAANGSIIDQSDHPLRALNVFRAALSRSLPFLALFIIVSLATFSVPAFLAILGGGIESASALTILSIISIAWIIATILLTMFSSYAIVIEKLGPIASIRRSAGLFLHSPLQTSLRFIGIMLATIASSLILAVATTIIIASLTNQTDLLFNADLAKSLVPWWKELVVSIFAYLGLPFLVIATTRLFNDVRAEYERFAQNHEPTTGDRIGNTRPA